MKKYYDLLIVGATALAAGVIKANPQLEIAVIESGCTCAAEFAETYRTVEITGTQKTAAAELLGEFEKRKAIDNNKIWAPSVSPILAAELKSSRADCYFFAAISEISSNDGRYDIAFTAYGVESRFSAGKLLDTTSEFITHAFFKLPKPKLTAKLNYYAADADNNLTLLSIPCPDCDIAAARLEVVDSHNDAKIVMLAPRLDTEPNDVCTTEYIWQPSSRFADVISAYDAGAMLDISKIVQQHAAIPYPIRDTDTDIVVVGLGTAGALAAVTAAREGLSVLGIESLSMSGGSGTAGGVLGYYYGYKGGLYREIDDYARGLNDKFQPTGGVGANQKTVALDRYEKISGVDCRYNAHFTHVIKDGNKVVGIRYTLDGVPHEVHSRFVIDCTAEGAVLLSAGCEMCGGRKSDGRFQPYSSVYFRYNNARVGMGYIDNGTVNHYDPDEFGKSIFESATSYIHLKNSYASHEYLGIAPLIGLREGYKLVGEENVDFESMISGKYTDKPIYYGWSNLDNHSKDSALEDRIYQDWITICGLWGWGVAIPIPMGALIPRGFDGLLGAGRSVAVDHNLAMGLRMKDDCQKSGEAAAELAALAIRDNIPAREVNVDELRKRLTASGCIKENDRMRIERQQSDECYELPLWCSDSEKLAAGIASDMPGYYMWSAMTLKSTELLIDMLDSDDTQARWHAALALSLFDKSDIGSNIGRLLDVLCECALSQDGYIAKTGRKYMNLRSVSAICALRRLAEKGALPTLKQLLFKLDELTASLPFEPYDFICDRDDLWFQYASHIVTALVNIAEQNADARMEVIALVNDFTSSHEFKTSLMGTVGFKLNCTPTIRQLAKSLN